MYVRCPFCETIFRATEAELSVRQGIVCCGVCQQIFNGTWNLLDSLPSIPAVPQFAALSNAEHDSPTHATATDGIADTNVAQRVANKKPGAEHGVATQSVTTDATATMTAKASLDVQQTNNLRNPATGRQPPGIPAAHRMAASEIAFTPAFYSERQARDPSIKIAVLPRHGRRSAWLWLSALLVVTILLLWQLNYFFFDALVQNQRLRPFLDQACAVVGCQLPARSNPALLVLFNTRILSHPADPQAVRVVSELQNHADFAQPAPLLQLSLSDPRGVVVARRSFPPSAYLAIGQRSTLAAGGSEKVILDLAAPGKSAVGFELKVVATARGRSNL